MIQKHDNTSGFIHSLEDASKKLLERRAPAWFHTLRREGIARFFELGVPTVKNEEWKYTNLSALTKNTYALIKKGRLDDRKAFDAYCDKDDINIVFVNGILSKELSNFDKAPQGITISTLDEAVNSNSPSLEPLLTKYAVKDEATFVALNEALNDHGTYISVDKNIVYPGLIHIIHVTSADQKNAVTMPRTLITMGASSEATVLESYVSFDDSMTYFANALTDAFLDENAILHYTKSQKESLKAFHIGHTRVWEERNARFDGFTLTVGGQLTRNDLDIVLNGEGGDATLNALYSTYHDQHVDNHTSVDHRVPNCTSNQLYKGILNGASRAVFNGKIFVRSVAQQTNSYQLNKNLLLGDKCRVDTKPQLEIYADDVKCTHGATIGQLDEDEMFYLQTRCIPRKKATQMLVHGFVEDLVQTVKHEKIREKINTLMLPSFEVLL